MFNLCYTIVHQISWYAIKNVVVNLKLQIMPTPPPVLHTRDSVSSNNSGKRGPPPGFEDNKRQDENYLMPHYNQSSFSLKRFERAYSPPVAKSNIKLVKKRPSQTKSTQNCIVPLVSELESDHEKKQINQYLNEISSKGQNESDSISDEGDHDRIKEEDEDDSIDEEVKSSPGPQQVPQQRNSFQNIILQRTQFSPNMVQRKSDSQLFGRLYFAQGSQTQSYYNQAPAQTPTVVLPGPEKSVQAIFEYKGQIAELAMSQQGSKYLQRVLTKASPDVVEFIIQEIGFKLSHLMTDQYGNYFCQKLLQSASSQQRYEMLTRITSNFYYIACNKSGTHSVQSLIEMINMDEEYDILQSAVTECMYDLACDAQGTYVIQKIIFCLKKSKLDYLILPIIDEMFELCKNTHGLSVIK